MKKYSLRRFLDAFAYNYSIDVALVERLCALTKCRADPNWKTGFESCYLFLALNQQYQFERFLEIGFGRGTTTYLMALQNSIKHVETYDIYPIDIIRQTWCDYKNVVMANAQFLFQCAEEFGDVRHKIEYHANNTLDIQKICGNNFDLIYIDGSHDYPNVLHDFKIAYEAAAENSIIVLDDYDPRYGVKKAVDSILVKHEGFLVSVNGHLYGEPEPEDCGHVIIPKGKCKELLDWRM